MTQYSIKAVFPTKAEQQQHSAQLNQIATATGLTHNARPSKSKLIRWLGDNDDLVIALIRAHRADPDGTWCALTEIGAGEIEVAAQEAAEEKR